MEENKEFKGWDFSYLDGRIEEEKLPWDYKSFICKYLNKDDMLLDMGTGGGEFLLSLQHPCIRGDGIGDNSSELFCCRILPRPVDTSYFTIFKSCFKDITNINIG